VQVWVVALADLDDAVVGDDDLTGEGRGSGAVEDLTTCEHRATHVRPILTS
jgi:hypothetical protein